jgi:hypothetical protein
MTWNCAGTTVLAVTGSPTLNRWGRSFRVAMPRVAATSRGDTDMECQRVVVRFTDAARVRWLRRPDGYLNEHELKG